jgi:hypothetical protein
MHLLVAAEKNKRELEESLRGIIEAEDDGLAALYKIYMGMEKNTDVETAAKNFKNSAARYESFISRQPWKALAWLFKLSDLY